MSKQKTKDVLKKLSKNYWAIAAIVLAILLIVVYATGSSCSSISANAAGNAVVDFAASQGAEAELVEVNDDGSLYEVVLKMQGQEFPVYVTKDGKNLVSGVVPLTTTQNTNTNTNTQSEEVPQTANPKAELFIWSYCPYGVTALEPFAQVAKLLGDNANFEVQLYYDGHGEYETQQNKIQACIQKYSKDKYWDYAISFANDIYPVCGQSRDTQCDLDESVKLMNSLGINSNTVTQCVDDEGEELITEDAQRAQEVGVTGSPSLVLNDVKVNSARNAEAYKQAVCSAFTAESVPADKCDESLSTTAATTSGSC